MQRPYLQLEICVKQADSCQKSFLEKGEKIQLKSTLFYFYANMSKNNGRTIVRKL